MKNIVLAVVLALIGVGVFSTSLSNTYLHVDPYREYEDAAITRIDDLNAVTAAAPLRWLTNASLGVQHQSDPGPMIGTIPFMQGVNLLIHALSIGLLFVIILRLTGHVIAAIGATLLFAVHPVHADAINSFWGRADLLSGAGRQPT